MSDKVASLAPVNDAPPKPVSLSDARALYKKEGVDITGKVDDPIVAVEPASLPGLSIQLHDCIHSGIQPCMYCMDCSTHRANDDASALCCRFQLCRLIHTQPSPNEPQVGLSQAVQQLSTTVEFTSAYHKSHMQLYKQQAATDLPSTHNAKYMLQNIAGMFSGLLQREHRLLELYNAFAQSQALVCRLPVIHSRDYCDLCKTTVFNLHMFCSLCGYTMCAHCAMNEQMTKLCMPSPLNPCQHGPRHDLRTMRLAKIIPDPEHMPLHTLDFIEGRMLAAMDWYEVPGECVCAQDHDHEQQGPSTSEGKERESVKCSCLSEQLNSASCVTLMALCESLVPRLLAPRMCVDDDDREGEGGMVDEVVKEDTTNNITALFQHYMHISKPMIIKFVGHNVSQIYERHNGAQEGFTPDALRAQIERNCDHNRTTSDCRLVDCITGSEMPKVTLDQFWLGYQCGLEREDLTNRMDCVRRGGVLSRQPVKEMKHVLKLKDYPSSASFSDVMQRQYVAYCAAMPVPLYMLPERKRHTNAAHFNLATYLPASNYNVTDLGPKMYIAYGMVSSDGENEDCATTQMHMDITDAVNVAMHVAPPGKNEVDNVAHAAAMSMIVRERVCERQQQEFMKSPELVWEMAAVWTIWHPSHTQLIDRFLKNELPHLIKQQRSSVPDAVLKYYKDNCCIELLNSIDHAIHDQNLYLPAYLRSYMAQCWQTQPWVLDGELVVQPGVQGYTFVQMCGDGVVIPAGAAHQVTNVWNCIKVAMDFCSPEGVANCAQVTAQLRHLPNAHSNKADKLQLCNLVLHTVIDCTLALQKESSREAGVSMVDKEYTDNTDKEAGASTEKSDKPRPATFWLDEKDAVYEFTGENADQKADKEGTDKEGADKKNDDEKINEDDIGTPPKKKSKTARNTRNSM